MNNIKKKNVFKDSNLQEKYLKDGYVVLPILNKEQIAYLINIHDSTHPAPKDLPNCYNTSDHVPDIETKRKIKKEIDNTLAHLYRDYLNGFKPIYSNFIGKQSGKNSNRELHQDSSFCDERVFDGYNIWIPLQDITKENSYFSIVKNSYKCFDSIRGKYITHKFDSYDSKIMENFCTNIYPKAGQALIYNTASIHYTPDNISNQTRIAVSVMSIPEEAKVNLFQSNTENNNLIERFEVDEDFLITHPAWKRIESIPPVEVIKYNTQNLSYADFKEAYYKINNIPKPSIWSKILG